ncbi:MAG: hypothetical protein GXP43_00415, partial [bacterium]|nr:hypothetical protein [bacterium]
NEPNLFGRFPMSDSPNGYLTLYSQTIQALPADSNLKPFSIGGPALSHADYKQIKKFVKFTRKNKLRLDFLSFHAYHTNPAKFVREVKNIKQILAASNLKTPVFITEWGVSGDRHPWYNTTRGYWHTLAVVSLLAPVLDPADQLFAFEIKDGPSLAGSAKQTAGWGLFTHENNRLRPKPRWFAFSQLSQLPWSGLITPQSSWPAYAVVTTNQTKDNLGMIVVNLSGKVITPTLKLRFLPNGLWQADTSRSFLTKQLSFKAVNNNSFDQSINLLPYSAVVIQWSQKDHFIRSSGRTSAKTDYSLNLARSYSFSTPIPAQPPGFKCWFWLKYRTTSLKPHSLFQLNLSSGGRSWPIASLKFGYNNFTPGFYLANAKRSSSQSIPLDSLNLSDWMPLSCSLAKSGLNFTLTLSLNRNTISLPVSLPSRSDLTLNLTLNKNPAVDVDDLKIAPLAVSPSDLNSRLWLSQDFDIGPAASQF